MIFSWAAMVIDGWLALWRTARRAWLAAPGDLMAWMVIRACGITATGRLVSTAPAAGRSVTTAIVVEDPAAAYYLDHGWIPIHAQTLGRYVFARGPLDDHTVAHELEHVRQWQRLGPMFLPAYVAASGTAILRRRPAYWGNRFEVAARRRADRDHDGRPGPG
jgi:hypothetical protein